MILSFTAEGWKDYQHWVATDRKVLKRVNRIIDAALRDPVSGEGKPEQLTANLSGYWSRRITQEHRLVYKTVEINGVDTLLVIAARYHYA